MLTVQPHERRISHRRFPLGTCPLRLSGAKVGAVSVRVFSVGRPFNPRILRRPQTPFRPDARRSLQISTVDASDFSRRAFSWI